jgi:gp6-like head-tail connector protein
VQQILNVLTPSQTYDLVTLDEMKMKLNIPLTDTSKDALLQELITNASDTIARLCNRVFAFEEVNETFYQLEDGYGAISRRLYLSRWPVAASDVTALTQDGTDILTEPTGWILEESTGTLYFPPPSGVWGGVIDVTYSGGYPLPDGAPGSLKFAVEAALRESYMSWIRSPGTFGVRLIAHKDSRVSYYGPNMFPTMGLPATWTFIHEILKKYTRFWV